MKQSMTIYTTPFLSPTLRGLARLALRIVGWRAIGALPPDIKKCVLSAAPHTSNWDFIIFLLVVFDLQLPLYVMIKHTLFWWPLGAVLRYCGGIAVNRQSPKTLVREIANRFDAAEAFLLVVTPEGTRRARTHWKTGFLRIAKAANVPVAVGYVDARHRTGGISDIVITPPAILDEAAIAAIMAQLYAFYDEKVGLRAGHYASPNRPLSSD